MFSSQHSQSSILIVVIISLSACVFGLAASASTSSTTYNSASASFKCTDPLRNVTALIYRDLKDASNYTIHTLSEYRNELQDAHRVDIEPINIVPKLCKNALNKMPRLQTLLMVLTSIEEIEPGAFDLPQLELLFLNDNRLKEIRSGVFSNTSIIELHLSGNRIYNIDPNAFDNMTRLSLLDLSFNQVQYIDEHWFKGSPKVQTLNFIFNLIPQLEANSFQHLNGSGASLNLWFMNNTISSIHKDAFKGLRRMSKLWLTANRLRYIDDLVFNDIVNIDALNLEDNEIFCLSERLLNKTRVNAIYLRGNPIICNCMAKLEQWSIAMNTKTYNSVDDLQRCGVKSKFIETTTQPPEGVLVEL